MKIPSAAVSLIALLASGCSTMRCHDASAGDLGEQHGFYRGVRFDWQSIAQASGEQQLAVPYYVIDMPFSLAGDTLFLPVDALSLLAKPKPGNSEEK